MRWLAGAALVVATSSAGAQSLADRIEREGDGVVRMRFAAREDVCGDGRDMIRAGRTIITSTTLMFTGRRTMLDRECVAGPVRVAATVRDGAVTRVQTSVGGSWRAGGADVRDLGTVSAPEAARYFLTLARRGDGQGRSKDVLRPAVLADSAVVWRDLLAIARDASLAHKLRSNAMMWVGETGTAETAAPLDALARDERGPGWLSEGALAALARLREGAGVPALMRLARGEPGGGQSRQTKALFWLGQTGDERARRMLRDVAADTRAAEGVRDAAIFSLGQQGEEEDHRFLRELFGSLTSRRLMDKVLMSVSQGAGREDEASQRWLLAVARDTARALEVRKQAVFWAGQGEADTDDIAALYDESRDRRMREHIIFVLSQRQDDEAADKLMAIAESDPDREMRKKAIFWLGQSDDPRATEFLRRMIAR